MNDQQRKQLIEAAIAANANAYAPYSKFSVGAAIIADSGQVYGGCNVENASFGLTICAERVALAIAVAAGERRFLGLAVATHGGATPCGACRQFAAEFCQNLPVLMIDLEHPAMVQEISLARLLPEQFQMREPHNGFLR